MLRMDASDEERRRAWPIAPAVQPPDYDDPSPPPLWPPVPAGQPVAQPSPPVPVGVPPRRRTGRLVVVLAAAVVVLVAGVVGAVVWASSASPRPAAAPSTRPARSASPSGSPGGPIAADEFGADGAPDPSHWDVYRSTAPNGSSWTPAMVRVADGELRVVGTGRDPTGKGNTSGGLCWCGAGGNRTYGIWQVRARFDAGAGYGPVIGLWPESNHDTDGTITFAGSYEPDHRTVHGYVVWNDGHRVVDEHTMTGDFTGWHTYTVEWRATFVKMSVDGMPLYDSTASTNRVVIPQRPMHLFIQQLVGPGDGVPAPDANTPAEVVTHVDWVHVYR
jgi:beta-glucanase (GH16 family)